MTLTSQQSAVLDSICSFIVDPEESVYILKGYAGTGKTTMIQSILPKASAMGKDVILMAPTGRAAKILREKTGCGAATIHRVIYDFEKMDIVSHDENGNLINPKLDEEVIKKVDDLQFWFKIKSLTEDDTPDNMLYIVDEASMISANAVKGEMLHFGTDVLLDDLMTYIQPLRGGKVIFIGDPAQLPPVGDNKSAALDEQYFISKGLKARSSELTEVLRLSGESGILKNAMKIRDLLESPVRNSISFDKGCDVMDIHSMAVAEKYCDVAPSPSIGDAVVICYSNAMVKDYNDSVRQLYFPEAKHVVAGDIIQIVKNLVHSDGTDLYNGDFARVLEVSETIETMSAPVWADLRNGRERVIVSVSFRDVTIQLENGNQISCKIIDDLLNNRERGLSPLQTLALYINFKMRFQESIKGQTFMTASEKKEAYKRALMSDPYYNAIQAKYGYAITAHKSQGGEWNTVFVDYSSRTGMNDDSLRWCYTATTRSSGVLYGVNFPNVTPLSKLTFNPVLKYSKPAKEAFSFGSIDVDAVIPASASPSQKAKYNCVKANLTEQGYLVERIDCLQYVDRYHIQTPEGKLTVDCQYNGTGAYTAYRAQSSFNCVSEVLDCLRNESGMEFSVCYQPSSPQMEALYSKMMSVCDDLDIIVTNIVEHPAQYFVAYYLKTSGRYSQIFYYFKNNGFITHAMPSSDMGTDDAKLVKLIDTIQT